MIKSKIIETVEEYDSDGKLTRKTVTEREETDDNPAQYSTTTMPWYFAPFQSPVPSCTVTCEAKE